jgi:mono/diheme cytochrome c family protein
MVQATPTPAARTAWVAAAALLWLVACGSGEPAETKAPAAPPAAAQEASAGAAQPDASAAAEAEQIFATRCTTCHGPEGAGNGPGSAGLDPPPRNFQDPEWQQSVTDDHIEKIIMYGGAAVGRSPAMPANPDLIAKKQVVAALRAHIRELGRR